MRCFYSGCGNVNYFWPCGNSEFFPLVLLRGRFPSLGQFLYVHTLISTRMKTWGRPAAVLLQWRILLLSSLPFVLWSYWPPQYPVCTSSTQGDDWAWAWFPVPCPASRHCGGTVVRLLSLASVFPRVITFYWLIAYVLKAIVVYILCTFGSSEKMSEIPVAPYWLKWKYILI